MTRPMDDEANERLHGRTYWTADEPDPYREYLWVLRRRFRSDADFVRWQDRFETPHAVLRALRRRFGLHLDQVAAHTGLRISTISRWETGGHMPQDRWTLEQLLSVPDYGLNAYRKSVVFMRYEWAPLFYRHWTPDWMARRLDALRAEPDDDPFGDDDDKDINLDGNLTPAQRPSPEQNAEGQCRDGHDSDDTDEYFEPLDPDDLLADDEEE